MWILLSAALMLRIKMLKSIARRQHKLRLAKRMRYNIKEGLRKPSSLFIAHLFTAEMGGSGRVRSDLPQQRWIGVVLTLWLTRHGTQQLASTKIKQKVKKAM